METVVLVFVLFVELLISGIFININSGQADKGTTTYVSWESKMDYANKYTGNSYQRYNGVTVDYYEVCALVKSSYGLEDCIVKYPTDDFTNNRGSYLKKKYLCKVTKETVVPYRTIVEFEEVAE